MAGTKAKAIPAKQAENPVYEFCGSFGAFGISFCLPILCYLMTFLCNDVTGCPVPSLLHPSTITLDKLKQEVNWPVDGIWGLASVEATSYVLGYYLFSLLLWRVLPAKVVQGTELVSGGRLNYKFNALSSSLLTLGLCAIGTIFFGGADFPLWTYIWDNYVQILTANLLIAYALATFVYVRSFEVKPGNKDMRELAAGGHTGNMLYDWFIGRELNPRVTIPVFGEIDIKSFMELRPGMLGWLILDYAFIAHQYKTYGFVTDSIIMTSLYQTLYVLDAMYWEPTILTQIDLTTDGFGCMLSFGDLVWLPFTYSLQAKYLAVYPHSLGIYGTLGVIAPLAVGYYIFRGANGEKSRFRMDPTDPQVAHLKYIETKSGGKLLVSGWWGKARHINYLGDWIMSWAYCLPTGMAGYLILRPSTISLDGGQSPPDGSFVGGYGGAFEVVQGEARGWGMIVTYFYMVYFAVLLIHREMRDDEKCLKKYGEDWKKYKKMVPSRIIPYIY